MKNHSLQINYNRPGIIQAEFKQTIASDFSGLQLQADCKKNV